MAWLASSVESIILIGFRLFPLKCAHVYSVFYDERIDNGLFPDIRILAVALTIRNNTYCQVWYPNMTHPVIKEATIKKNGGGHKFNKTQYEQYYLTCPLDTSYPIPNYVSLVAYPCDQADNYIPIFVPIRAPFKHDFAISQKVNFCHYDIIRYKTCIAFHITFNYYKPITEKGGFCDV